MGEVSSVMRAERYVVDSNEDTGVLALRGPGALVRSLRKSFSDGKVLIKPYQALPLSHTHTQSMTVDKSRHAAPTIHSLMLHHSMIIISFTVMAI